jgi:hypothetical protein
MAVLDQKGVTIPVTRQEIEQVIERARKGDESVYPVVARMLEFPHGINLFCGDLARNAMHEILHKAGGEDIGFKEAAKRKMELLRAELEGPNPSAVEKLLVERIVICWLQLYDADIRYYQAKDPSLAQADFLQRRMDRAHNRYLSALKTLATVRRLALPVLIGQVNLAKNQVNVSNPNGQET